MTIPPVSSQSAFYPSSSPQNLPPPEAGTRRTGVRARRSDTDSDSEGSSRSNGNDGPPAKRPRTEAPRTQSTTAAPPDAKSDAYADYVSSVGAQRPLSRAQLDSLAQGVDVAVRRSQGWIVDQHTADTIRDTIRDALERSPTFRAAVSYGMYNRHVDLDDVLYRTPYLINPEVFDPTAPLDVRTLTLADLEKSNANTVPLFPMNDAHADDDRYANPLPHINIGAAPDAGSTYMPTYRYVLMHELMHQLTGCLDPDGPAQNVHGPTEILSRGIAKEMGWSIPASSGYHDPARVAHILETDRAALIDAARRHADHEHGFFERLDTISRSQAASSDFHELGNRPTNETQPHSPDADLSVLDQLELDPSVFSLFADSAPDGAPTGFASASAASDASWETQGRFFRYGVAVNGNRHQREFGFPDGSKVVVRAHEPMLADSDGLKFGRFLTVASTTAVGALGGLLAGGPVGAAAGAAVAAAPAYGLASSYGYDRIWQGYTLDYYARDSATPFKTQYMYAWDSDPKRVDRLSKISDPNKWFDYAQFSPDRHWNWWTWRVGEAPLRQPESSGKAT